MPPLPACPSNGVCVVQLVQYELRVVSLEAGSVGQVLAARSIAAADCLTCVQVSPTGQHVLLAYGRRSKQLSCLVAAQGSYQVWHTVLQVGGATPDLVSLCTTHSTTHSMLALLHGA